MFTEVNGDELIKSNRALTVNIDFTKDVLGVFSVYCAFSLHVEEVEQLFESNSIVVVPVDTLKLGFKTVENSLVLSFNFDILPSRAHISCELLLKRLPRILNFLRVIIIASMSS